MKLFSRMNKSNKMLRFLANKRIYILALIGFGFYYGIFVYHLSLWYPLAIGVALGLIFGKVFCRWACPMGLIMEVMMGFGGDNATKMYQYHKLGCPIAWVSGWLNKYSFFKIKMNSESCLNCGKCDKACYMSSLEPDKFSLYKPKFITPGENYSCSKCLKCVAACPNGSLTYKI
jgi:polyferredoxin